MKDRLQRFAEEESGATAIEYALIGSVIGLGIISGLQLIAPELNVLFADIVSNF